VARAAEVLNVPISLSGTSGPEPCPDGASATRTVKLKDPGGTGAYAFDPDGLTFSTGDCVEITIEAETEFHTFTVGDLGIDQSADGGETVTFTFTFAEAGEFGLICVPHESLGMVGTITVQ
jgi:plastocyanin